MKEEIEMMLLEVKEGQRLLGNHQKLGKRYGTDSLRNPSLESFWFPEGINPAEPDLGLVDSRIVRQYIYVI